MYGQVLHRKSEPHQRLPIIHKERQSNCPDDFTQSVNQRAVPHRGPRSGCRPLKLTAGICRPEGRMWSLATLKALCGSSGERRGERRGERSPPRPSLLRGGIGGRGECSTSDPDPSSTSLMDGSFLPIPPLLSQSA